MPVESTVYRVLLVMPSELLEERRLAKSVLLNWNTAVGRQQNIHLGPIDARHVDTDRADLAEDVDIVLGSFWTKADETASGTNLADVVRELAIDNDIPAMIGFSERDIPTNRLVPCQPLAEYLYA